MLTIFEPLDRLQQIGEVLTIFEPLDRLQQIGEVLTIFEPLDWPASRDDARDQGGRGFAKTAEIEEALFAALGLTESLHEKELTGG